MAGAAASPAEGSSIFENLFGGFSNGLSVFTNNSFRRKNELPRDDQEKKADFAIENLSGSVEKQKESAGNVLDKAVADDGDLPNTESTKKKVKMAKEDGVVSEKKKKTKKRKITESTGTEDHAKARQKKLDLVVNIASVEKIVTADGIHDLELKKKKKVRKVSYTEADSEQVAQIDKESQDDDLLAVEKVSIGEEVLDSGGTVTKPEELGEEIDNQKKMKKKSRLVDVDKAESHIVETLSRSKRKPDFELEELYERKRRQVTDGKENKKSQIIAEHRAAEDGDDESKGLKRTKANRDAKVDNEEKLKRTIFVGNLPVSVKTKHLSREFSKFGAVDSARLRSVPLVDSKLPRKAAVITGQLNESRSSLNAYVVFVKEESARAALAHNMAEFNGKHLRVDMATAPRKSDHSGESRNVEYDRTRSIFVGNLPFAVEDEEIYALFQGKGPDLDVEAVRVVRDPQTSIGKGFAFVCFKKKLGASTALDNAKFTKLRNRPLRILRYGSQNKKPVGASARPTLPEGKTKPRPGVEQRLSRKGVLSYEGTRSSKADGRPGKALTPTGSVGQRGSSSNLGKSGTKNVTTKRPSVAARKLASKGLKAIGSGKKKGKENGKRGISHGKKKKFSK